MTPLVAAALLGCREKPVDQSASTTEHPVVGVTCKTELCVRVRAIFTRPGASAELQERLVRELERTNAVFSPHGVSFQLDPKEDIEARGDELLDHDCTLTLPNGKTLTSYRDASVPPPCKSAPNERSRLSVADRSPGKLTLFVGSGARPRFDEKKKQWVMHPRGSSHSGYFAGFVFLTPQGTTQPWLLAHEIGHYFHLRHPHRDQPKDLAAVTRALCSHPISSDVQTLFDGDLGFVNDTPPDLLPRFYASLGKQSPGACSPTSEWIARAPEMTLRCPDESKRRLSLRPPPLRENAMSYWKKGCLDRKPSLTEDQGRQVRDALEWLNRGVLVGKLLATSLAPDAADYANHRHVVVAAADRSLRHHWYEANATDDLDAWSETSNDFAVSAGGPPAIVASAEKLHLLVIDRQGHLLHKWWEGRDWHPRNQAWVEVGAGLAKRRVAAVTGGGRLEVFALGSDSHLHTRVLETRGWQSWVDLGGAVADVPAARARSDGSIDVVVRREDHRLYHRHREARGWSPWKRIGDTPVEGAPALATLGAQTWVFARSVGGALVYSRRTGRNWSTFEPVARDRIAGDPIAVSPTSSRVDVLARDRAGQLVHKWFTNADADPIARPPGGAFEHLEGPVHSTLPAVTVHAPERLDIHVTSRRGGLWWGQLQLRERAGPNDDLAPIRWQWLGRW